MSLMARDAGGGQDFAPVPAGMHQAVCYAVIDIGTQPQFGNFPARRKVIFCWEIPSCTFEIEREGRRVKVPRAVSKKFTLSLASKSNMRPMLESWRGRPFSADELSGFDIGTVVGANCFLNVVHKQGTGPKANRTYAEVASVNPLVSGMMKFKPVTPALVFSLDDFKEGEPVAIPAAVPEWITGLILQSEEYAAHQRADHNPQPPPATHEEPEEDVPF